MRVVQFAEYGGPEVLRVAEATVPEPSAGELLVEVDLAGVTLPVVRLTEGGVDLPHAPGGDVVGRVVAVGEGLSGWQVGQRVAGLAGSGAYADYVVLNAALSAAIPDGVDDAAAVALVRGGQVALGVLGVADLKPGESVLVTGAAGGVGHLAVQLARALGAGRVVGAVGSADKREFVSGLGADDVVGYADDSWGDPVDIVLDGVGGDVQQQAVDALAPFGRLVSFNGVGAPVDVNELRFQARTVIGFTMARLARHRPEVYAANREKLWELCASGQLVPAVHATFPLDKAAQAHELMTRRRNLGRVLLSPR